MTSCPSSPKTPIIAQRVALSAAAQPHFLLVILSCAILSFPMNLNFGLSAQTIVEPQIPAHRSLQSA